MRTAFAQTPVAGLEPHVDLKATLSAEGASPAAARQFNDRTPVVTFRLNEVPSDEASARLFPEEQPKEGGWKALASLLEALTPGVDTETPLTPSQITDRITAMLDQGHNQEALDIIDKRMAQRQAANAMGTDVQLLFLRARALGALERHNEAIAVYLNMTTLYPELPEPWNNLASEYVKQGKLEMAQDALKMALAANPNYAAAKANMGSVQLMLAKQSFDRAAQLGISSASSKAEQTQSVLQQ